MRDFLMSKMLIGDNDARNKFDTIHLTITLIENKVSQHAYIHQRVTCYSELFFCLSLFVSVTSSFFAVCGKSKRPG